MFKNANCWLDGLKDVDRDRFEGASDEREPSPKGQVSVGPPRDPVDDLFPKKHEHLCAFGTTIDRHSQVSTRKRTRREASFPLNRVGPSHVRLRNVKITFAKVNLLPGNRLILGEASSKLTQGRCSCLRENNDVIGIGKVADLHAPTSRLECHFSLAQNEPINGFRQIIRCNHKQSWGDGVTLSEPPRGFEEA